MKSWFALTLCAGTALWAVSAHAQTARDAADEAALRQRSIEIHTIRSSYSLYVGYATVGFSEINAYVDHLGRQHLGMFLDYLNNTGSWGSTTYDFTPGTGGLLLSGDILATLTDTLSFGLQADYVAPNDMTIRSTGTGAYGEMYREQATLKTQFLGILAVVDLHPTFGPFEFGARAGLGLGLGRMAVSEDWRLDDPYFSYTAYGYGDNAYTGYGLLAHGALSVGYRFDPQVKIAFSGGYTAARISDMLSDNDVYTNGLLTMRAGESYGVPFDFSGLSLKAGVEYSY